MFDVTKLVGYSLRKYSFDICRLTPLYQLRKELGEELERQDPHRILFSSVCVSEQQNVECLGDATILKKSRRELG